MKYLDGRAMARQVLLTSRKFFERLARRRPLVLVFEDLDWVDRSSAELLEHLLPLVETAPLLVCMVSRGQPGTLAARLRDTAASQYAAHYSAIALSPLPAAACAVLSRVLRTLSAADRALDWHTAGGGPELIRQRPRAQRKAAAGRPAGGSYCPRY